MGAGVSYDPANLWSEAEDRAVAVYYPRHGTGWEGWAEVLPNRTKRAIAARAARIGVAIVRGPRRPRAYKPKAADPRHKSKRIRLEPDPYEGTVIDYMAQGMTPSEIDACMGWHTGTTRLILTNRWERESDI